MFIGFRNVFSFLLIFGISVSAEAGQILSFGFHSATLGRDWHYNAYIPDGYNGSKLRYSVMYLLHGYSEDENTWVGKGRVGATIDRLIANGDVPPILIVMPGSGNSWYVDAKEKYESAFINDLLPEIEQRFRTLTDREGRAIGGDSMGGYGSLRFILKYPEKFSAAMLMSPAIYVPEPPPQSSARKPGVFGDAFDADLWKNLNYPNFLEPFFAKNLPITFYVNSGDHDDFEIETQIAPVYKLMRDHKFPVEMRVTSGTHEWSVWRNELPEALTFVLGDIRRPQPDEAGSK